MRRRGNRPLSSSTASSGARSPEPKPTEAEPTVAGLAERFMRDHVGTRCKPDTAATYRSLLKNHILPALGGMTIADIDRARVSALHHSLRETPTLANRAVVVLSKMFSLAEAWGLLPAGQQPVPGASPLPDAEAGAVPDAR